MNLTFVKKIQAYGIAGGFLVLVILTGVFFGPIAQTQRASNEPLLKGLNPSQVTEVRINDFSLVKEESGSWSVRAQGASFPGEQEKLDNLFKTLGELKIQRTVTQSGDSAGTYGFSSGLTAVVLLDKAGTVLASLDTGSVMDNGRQIYVRQTGSQTIYLTDRLLSTVLNNNYHSWTDLRLFVPAVEEKAVVGIDWKGTLAFGDKEVGPFQYVRQVKDGNETWINGKDQSPVEGMASKLPVLVKLQAQENGLDSQGEFAALPHNLKITVGTAAIEFRIGNKDASSRFPVEVRGRKFWVSEYSLRDLLLQ